jgi:hypothetical protein
VPKQELKEKRARIKVTISFEVEEDAAFARAAKANLKYRANLYLRQEIGNNFQWSCLKKQIKVQISKKGE